MASDFGPAREGSLNHTHKVHITENKETMNPISPHPTEKTMVGSDSER